MRLNHDCIRDILLYIEKTTTDEIHFIKVPILVDALSADYDKSTLLYHIQHIHKAGLVDDVRYAENMPMVVFDLSPEGHNYVNNIRDNKVWQNVKKKTNSIGSVALSIMVDCAKSEVKKRLGLS